jgi:hypothetical protein
LPGIYQRSFLARYAVTLDCLLTTTQDFGGIDFSKLGGAGGDAEEEEEEESDDEDMPALEGEEEDEEETPTAGKSTSKIQEVN